MPEGKSFSGGEVMALIESFENNIKIIAEDTGALREDMTEVKERLTNLETEVRTIKDAVNIAIPSQEIRLKKLETKASV